MAGGWRTLSTPDHPAGKIHWRNTYEQLKLVGPKSMGVALLTAGFVGMVFTIQVGLAAPLSGCGQSGPVNWQS